MQDNAILWKIMLKTYAKFCSLALPCCGLSIQVHASWSCLRSWFDSCCLSAFWGADLPSPCRLANKALTAVNSCSCIPDEEIYACKRLEEDSRSQWNETDIHLWKQYSKAECNNKTGDWTQPFSMSTSSWQSMWMSSAGETNYLREFHPARILWYAWWGQPRRRQVQIVLNQIIVIHESVLAAFNLSATKLRRNLA
jgi:hypothetical protein